MFSRPIHGLLVVCLLVASGCTVRMEPPLDARPGRPDGGTDAPSDGGPDSPDGGPPPAVVFIEPGAPSDSPGRFEDVPGPLDLTVVYPPDGVLLPPNLDGLEIQFGDASWDVYELAFDQEGAPRMRVYTTCTARGAGCVLALSDAMWEVLAGARAGGPITVTVRARQRSGGPIARAAPITIELADEPVTGGLYFWTTEPAAIHRYDFDREHHEAEVFFDSTDAEGHCVGCHAVSRDGHDIAVGLGTEGPFTVVDVATRALGATIAGEMFAFSPDGTQLVVGGIPDPTRSPPLEIVRTDGTGLAQVLGLGASPDWSPDGRVIAATMRSGAIQLWDGEAGSWAPRSSPLTAGTDTFDQFPSFAPDSEWIAFSRETPSATAPGGMESHVWAIRGSGGAEVRLARASTGTMDSMPRWNPTTFLHEGRRLFWVTFTSSVDYGFEPAGRSRRIWMAAFSPSSTAADPSWPAFYLPAQPTTGSNFIPQWTADVLRQPCDGPAECRAGEFCDDGVCVPDVM